MILQPQLQRQGQTTNDRLDITLMRLISINYLERLALASMIHFVQILMHLKKKENVIINHVNACCHPSQY